MTNVVRPTISWATAAEMRSSVAGSTRAVASSSTTRSGWRSHTRARARSCACPADSPAPAAPSGRSMPPAASDVQTDRAERGDHRLVARLRVVERHVVADRALEQLHLLGHESDPPAQLGHRDVGDVDPAQAKVSRGRLDEAQHEARERGLAAAGAPDDADRTAAGDLDVDVVEDRSGIVVVGEPDAAAGHGERARRRRLGAVVDDGRLERQQLGDTTHRPVGLLHRLQLLHQVLERAGHQLDVLEQQEGRAEGDHAALDEQRRQRERQHRADGDRQAHRPPHPQERALRGAPSCRAPPRSPRRSATSRAPRRRWSAGPRSP